LGNPLKYIDPDGHVPVPIVTGAIGGVIGGIVFGIGYGINIQASGQQFSWSDLGVAVGGGAVTGALIGSGAALVTGAAAGTTAFAVGGIAVGAGLGGATAGGGYLGGNTLMAFTTNGAEGHFDAVDFDATVWPNTVAGGVKSIPGVGMVGRVAIDGMTGMATQTWSDAGHGRSTEPEKLVFAAGFSAATSGAGEVFDAWRPVSKGRTTYGDLSKPREIGQPASRIDPAVIRATRIENQFGQVGSGFLRGTTLNISSSFFASKLDK
jgi:hypothetical protein